MNSMKFTNGKHFSHPGSVVNEDICCLKDAHAWVIDGSSGLTSTKITDADSDAKWFVTEWDKYLRENIMKDKSIHQILENGITEIKNKYFRFDGAKKTTRIEHPSASMIILRQKNKELEYFALGDCTLLYEKGNGEVIRVWDDTVAMLDSKVINSMYSIHKEKNVPMVSARAYVKDMLQEHRLMKNTDEGYWILGMDECAIKHGIYNKLNMKDVQKVCIFSDGFAQYYDTLHLTHDYRGFLDKVSKLNLDKLYEELWQAQEEDKDCSRFPRLKVRDDVSIVYFETPSIAK